MSEPTYLLTEAQRDDLNAVLQIPEHVGEDAYKKAIAMLQSLPMVADKPYAIEAGFDNGDGSYSVRLERLPVPGYKFKAKDWEPHEKLLYTSPQLTPITADDVTDEMIDELARICPTYNTVEHDRQTIAAAYNVVIDGMMKRRGDTK